MSSNARRPQSAIPQHRRMLEIAAAAPLSLSQHFQPHAQLPHGNCVPLHSEAFYSWLLLALAEKGFTPTPHQIGYILRQLDAQAHTRPFLEPVHLRSTKSAPQLYKVEFSTISMEVIEITANSWRIEPDFETRFYRPESSFPFFRPEPIKESLPTCLSKLFRLPSDKSRELSSWLAHALLGTPALPTLILTGKQRQQAALKLRTILDPSASSILELPRTSRDLGRLALTNSVMVFSIYTHLPKGKIEMFNQLRHGMPVRLKEVNKHRPPLTTLVHRPIIISAEKAPKVHEEQLVIEVNEVGTTEVPKVFAALLDAAVQAVAQSLPEPFFVELEDAAPVRKPLEPPSKPEDSGPAP